MLRHLPNLLSALRLLAAPLAAFLILVGADTAALTVFVLAGVSDAADGFIARRWGYVSRFGAWLDPAADKLLMLVCFIALWRVGAAPLWLAMLVVGRDLLLAAGAGLIKIFALPVRIAPIMLGKISTIVQVCYIALLLLLRAFSLNAPHLVMALGAATALLIVASWLGYTAILLRALMPGRRAA
jgi:cardiolipin synthase